MSEENNIEQVEQPVAVEETVVSDAPVVDETTEVVEDAPESTVEATDAEPQTQETKQPTQEEFNKLYFQLKQAERDLKQTQEATQEVGPMTDEQFAQAITPATTPPPKLADFDYDEERHTAALIEYKVNEQVSSALANQRTADAQAQEQAQLAQQNATVIDTFNANATAYAEANPSYNDAIANGASLVYDEAIRTVLLTSEHGPAIDHMLLNNPVKADQINAMPLHQAYMELARMEASVSPSSPKAATNTVSNAPAPIGDIATGGNVTTGDVNYNDNLSMDDYYKSVMDARKR